MSRVPIQKTKLLHLLDILSRESDEEHCLSAPELARLLNARGVPAERKSIYSDIEMLREMGHDIERMPNRGYCLLHRDFELAELKLLVDAVQSSRFIPAGKSEQLIEKLEQLTSRHQASALQRQVYVAGRVKSLNQSIYYNIDSIHTAIARQRQITFRYFKFDRQRRKVYRRGGEPYRVSPFTLLRSDENYYLIAYDPQHEEIRHYRVDKMDHIDVTQRRIQGEALYQDMDLGEYARIHFGMFRGSEANVILRCENAMADILIDRFGEQVSMVPVDEEHFNATVHLAVSPQFFGWLCGLGRGISIAAPDWVAYAFRNHMEQVLKQYR